MSLPRLRVVVPAWEEGAHLAVPQGGLTLFTTISLPASVDVGLHLDLLGRRGLLALLARFLGGRGEGARAAEAAVLAQAAALRAAGRAPAHLAAHRHAWALPALRCGAVRGGARAGIRCVGAMRPRSRPKPSGIVAQALTARRRG